MLPAIGFLVALASVVCLVLGLIKPRWTLPFAKQPKRIQAVALACVLFFVGVVVLVSGLPPAPATSTPQ